VAYGCQTPSAQRRSDQKLKWIELRVFENIEFGGKYEMVWNCEKYQPGLYLGPTIKNTFSLLVMGCRRTPEVPRVKKHSTTDCSHSRGNVFSFNTQDWGPFKKEKRKKRGGGTLLEGREKKTPSSS
jgi:hypothetical protein